MGGNIMRQSAPAGPPERLQRTNTILKSSYSKVRHPLIPAHVSRVNNFVAARPSAFRSLAGQPHYSKLDIGGKNETRYAIS
jgi:hypothetical protein